MLGGFCVKFVGTIMDLALPWILSYILDNVIPARDRRMIWVWGGIMVVCSVLALVGNVVANRLAAKVARDTTERIRHDVFVRITRLSARQTDELTIPSLISRLSSDSYNVHQMIGMVQRLGVRAPILLIGGIIVTLSLDLYLTLVLIAILPLLTLVVYVVSKHGIPLYTKVQQAQDVLVRKVQEYMGGVRVIKALSKTGYERDRYDGINREVVKRDQKAGMIMGITNPVMNLFLNTGLAVVIIVGAFRVNSGAAQPGMLIAFLSYFTIILNAMMSITRLFVNLSKGAASAGRIEEVLEYPDDLLIGEKDHIDTENHIEFDDVSFSYGGVRDNLSHISFSLRRGQTLGVIGATGSGKSTIINLLMRFYDADQGVIRINGDDIKCLSSSELHTRFGAAFQSDFLFEDTIRENIDFGRGCSDEDIRVAVETAQAADFISQYEDGLMHMLTVRGANLSGGQKQRLLIARALAGRPEILILDDSSSALDYATDSRLRRAIHENYADTTSIIIAQRISSIMNADLIIMIDDGRIIGMGSHKELMRSCPDYIEIAHAQMDADGGEVPVGEIAPVIHRDGREAVI